MPTDPAMVLPKVASVDDATIDKVVHHGGIPVVRRKKRAPWRNQPEVVAEWKVSVDPRVWEVAKSLAVDYRHIQIRSESEVIVWNHPAPWPV